MDVSLKCINADNYEEISLLEVEEYQEDYISSNMWSLVEAAYNENYVVRGIYLSNEPIGFFMWVKENDHKIATMMLIYLQLKWQKLCLTSRQKIEKVQCTFSILFFKFKWEKL